MSTKLTDPVSRVHSPSQRVVEAVADAIGRDPTEVGPLYHVIDPDALDNLFEATGGSTREDGYVQFSLSGCDVVVRGDGSVEVTGADAVEVDVDESPSSVETTAHESNSDGIR